MSSDRNGGAGGEMRFTIKQIADLFHITRGAVRFYQEKGLISPTVADNGYRSYSMDDFFQLLYLKRYASMALPLGEVAGRFRRESDASVGDIVDYLSERENEVRDGVRGELRKLRALRRYRQRLQEMREGAVEIVEAGEYWGLVRERIPDAAREEPDAVERLIALLPATMIGGVYDLRTPGKFVEAELRVLASTARGAGLACSRFFHIMPAARLARTTLRFVCDGDGGALNDQILCEFDGLAERMRAQGSLPGETGFSELVFVHREQGVSVEYHSLYLPLEDRS